MKTQASLRAVPALLFLSSASAFAANVTWNNGGADGQWTTPENWSNGAVPTVADDVTISGTLPADSIIHLGADQSAKSIKLNVAAVLEGDGQNTVSVVTGLRAGGVSPIVHADVVLNGHTTMGAGGWGKNLIIAGAVTGTAGGINTDGGQNSNVFFLGPVSVSGAITSAVNVVGIGANSAAVDGNGDRYATGGTLVSASEIVLYSHALSYSRNIQTTLRIDNRIDAINNRIGAGIPLRTAPGGGALDVYGNSAAPVTERLDSILLENSTLYLHANAPGGTANPLHFSVGAFEHTPGTTLMTQIDTGAYLHVDGAANNASGVWVPWAMNTAYEPLRVVEDATLGNYIAPFPAASYVAFDGSGASSGTGALARMTDNAVSLSADNAYYHLRVDGRTAPTIHLGDHDLTLGDAGLVMYGKGDFAIDSTGGALRFNTENEIRIVMQSNDTGATGHVSAPLEWVPTTPAAEGEDPVRPSLVLNACCFKNSDLFFDGEDRVGDYDTLCLPRVYDYNSPGYLSFAGPSNRTFHGPVQGAGFIKQAGSGRLSLLGPCYIRNSRVAVSDGELYVGASYPECYVYGPGTMLIGEGVSYGSDVKFITEGGTLGGLGRLTRNIAAASCVSGSWLMGGSPDDIGVLTINGITPAGDFGVRLTANAETNGLVKLTGTLTLTSVAADSVFTVEISDPSRGYGHFTNRRFPVLQWNTLTGDFNTAFGTLQVTTRTPRFVDVSNARIEIDAATKTLYVSGVESIGLGTTLILR